jgi:hypothetical protein
MEGTNKRHGGVYRANVPYACSQGKYDGKHGEDRAKDSRLGKHLRSNIMTLFGKHPACLGVVHSHIFVQVECLKLASFLATYGKLCYIGTLTQQR